MQEQTIDTTRIETRAFINGQYIESKARQFIQKKSSFTGENIVRITACGAEDVDIAVQCARAAYEKGTWRFQEPTQRKDALLRLADLMEKHRQELAALDTYETGRAYQNYYNDSIPKAIEAVRYFAEAVDKYYDQAITPRRNAFDVIVREPLGVVGIITPWNDPMVVASWKFTPALLMGNSVVIKPAEQSSLSLIRVAALVQQAGIPDGVFNVVPGYGETAGQALALHMDVNGIFFTGSSETGKKIIQNAGQSNMKKVGLECGGKSPLIITEHCGDLQNAAQVLAANVFYNQGQICSAPSRAIVHRNVKEEFLRHLFAASEKYVPGNPWNDDNIVGCTVSGEQYAKVLRYIELGKKESGGCYIATSKKDLPNTAKAVQPTIFYDVSPDARIAQEEIFGPVIAVLDYTSPDDALRIANCTRYGLAGGVFTDDINEAYYFANGIRSGLVHINSFGEDDNMSPFGGWKESGWGKDKSVYAFDEYSALKSIWMKFSCPKD